MAKHKEELKSPEELESERLGSILNAMGAMAGRRASDRHSTITPHRAPSERYDGVGRIEWHQVAEDASLRITQQWGKGYAEGVEITAIFSITPGDAGDEHLELASTEHAYTFTIPDEDKNNAVHYYDVVEAEGGNFETYCSDGKEPERLPIGPDELEAFLQFALAMDTNDAAAFAPEPEAQ